MVEASQIRDVIAAFVAKADADEFVLSFGKLSYNIYQEGTPEAIELADKVEWLMAAVHSPCEHCRKSVGEFRQALAELA